MIVNSILDTFKSFTDYDSCSSRKEYWTYALFVVCAIILSCMLLVWIFPVTETVQYYQAINDSGHLQGPVRARLMWYVDMGYTEKALYFLFLLFLLIPGIAVTVRKLHDSGHSGFWFFIQLIPTIGFVVLLFFMLLPTNKHSEYRDDFFEQTGS